jgi:hypothetical protein
MLRGQAGKGLTRHASRTLASSIRQPKRPLGAPVCRAAMIKDEEAMLVDQTLNPILLAVRPSKTMAFTDMATAMKEEGIDVSSRSWRV